MKNPVLLISAVLVFLVLFTSSGARNTTDPIVGAWNLVSIDGVTLPHDGISAGSMIINEDNTYIASATPIGASPIPVNGTWSKLNSTYYFSAKNGKSTGALSGNTLTRVGRLNGAIGKTTLAYSNSSP
jgi:hypothetical protein